MKGKPKTGNINVGPLLRQIQLGVKLLTIIATDKDFANHQQNKQISILGKMGFRQNELAEIFGASPQYINKVFRQFKVKIKNN